MRCNAIPAKCSAKALNYAWMRGARPPRAEIDLRVALQSNCLQAWHYNFIPNALSVNLMLLWNRYVFKMQPHSQCFAGDFNTVREIMLKLIFKPQTDQETETTFEHHLNIILTLFGNRFSESFAYLLGICSISLWHSFNYKRNQT